MGADEAGAGLVAGNSAGGAEGSGTAAGGEAGVSVIGAGLDSTGAGLLAIKSYSVGLATTWICT